MSARYQPTDLSKLQTYDIDRRAHRFELSARAGLPDEGASFRDWWESLPPLLGAAALHELARSILAARRDQRPVVFALGAHVVKVGCSPIVCDLMRRGIVTALAMNGATAIHDVEVACFGRTSEDVADTLRDGRFGMVRQTPQFFADALSAGTETDAGLGAKLGAQVEKTNAPHKDECLLGVAHQAGVPATVHVALGTDTIHMHDVLDAGELGRQSAVDFRLACSVVADLAPSEVGGAAGVWCNIGSAVILPEVFLKAVAVARNLGANLDDITTANLDMMSHYRPAQNVIGRPVRPGRGLQIIGHHEIMLPLLRQALIELQ